ncbi:hypothetical protein MTER_24820 [Mycolicibacter terrae]|uniref:Uncharacterized protein n=1 Tax=Mycolicibacter terrae TaxID=1788 RepID=A0AAD1I398_9MYCO|nr:hypothetical protein MTER_24820 [Mycolicibacter terrae]SNV68232.1 Uncharacterised protein [Mycolicibacter terrae]
MISRAMIPISTAKPAHSVARPPDVALERPVGVGCGLVVGGTPHLPVGTAPGVSGGGGGVGSWSGLG